MRPIIVEGCDNSGKTTLIQKLVKAFESEVVLSCRSIPLEDQIEWIQNEINRTNTNVIYDRFPLISEQVYGPILRGGSKFDDLPINHCMDYDEYARRVLHTLNPIIIYCRPSTMTISSTFHEREQLEGTAKNLHEIINAYDILFHKMQISMKYDCIFTYDWRFDTYAKHIIHLIAGYDLSRPFFRNYLTGGKD